MPCNITDGINLDCLESVGGIELLWILGSTGGTLATFNFNSVTSVNTSDEVYGTGMSPSVGVWYKFAIPKDTANFTETITPSQTNGTVFYAADLVLAFHKLETVKRNQIKLLAKNRDLRVIFKDNNANYWLMGAQRGCFVTTGSAATGTLLGDANQYSLTIHADEPNMTYKLAGTVGGLTASGFVVES